MSTYASILTGSQDYCFLVEKLVEKKLSSYNKFHHSSLAINDFLKVT